MTKGTETPNPPILEEGLLSPMDTTTLIPTSDIHVSFVDDAAIVLNLDSGEYHTLNPVGQFFWKLLTPENTLSTHQIPGWHRG